MRENYQEKNRSLLELLHPDGRAGRCLVIGSNCPPMLFPGAAMQTGESADLIILAPSIEQCTTDGWLTEAGQLLARSLAADGVGYILAPRRWRFQTARLVRHFDLVIDSAVVHLPDWASSHYLVPIARAPLGYALSVIAPAPASKRALIGQWFQLPRAGEMFGYIRSSAGLVVRRPGARPLFEWLFRQDGGNGHSGSALIHGSWRGKNGAAVIYRFSEGDAQPSAVAKVVPAANSSADPWREAAALARLGPAIQGSGIQVPQLLFKQDHGTHSTLIETFVGGQPAADVLRLRPERLTSTVKRVVRWLERWYRMTVIHRPFSAEQANNYLLEPAALLAPLLTNGEEYQNWLARRSKSNKAAFMPLVDAHNDLTMANILLDEKGGMGVIDWETGTIQAWPLVDFFYAITDAVMMACGWADRLDAFIACFAPSGVYAPAVARLQARLASAIEIPEDMDELCFHACWLHHAVNEHRSSPASASRPFLRIVQWLALHQSIAGERRD